jgi:hypothetical protein
MNTQLVRSVERFYAIHCTDYVIGMLMAALERCLHRF